MVKVLLFHFGLWYGLHNWLAGGLLLTVNKNWKSVFFQCTMCFFNKEKLGKFGKKNFKKRKKGKKVKTKIVCHFFTWSQSYILKQETVGFGTTIHHATWKSKVRGIESMCFCVCACLEGKGRSKGILVSSGGALGIHKYRSRKIWGKPKLLTPQL